jgi:outer membrane receptor protein involved in Fe transport
MTKSKKTIATILIALLAANASAQEPSAVHGSVHDATTDKPIAGVSVYAQETDEVALTDDRGEFVLVTPGAVHLVVVDPSYQRAEARADASAAIAVRLQPVSLRGDEVVVEAEREHAAAGEITLSRDEIEHVPGSRGDALQAIKNLPGIANGGGMSFGNGSGLVVRGSAPRDSRVFVDGFEIPILYHLGGIQSVMPTEMIDDVRYSPGNYGVELGRASGGAIEVMSRPGDRTLGGFAEVSFVSASAALHGPLGKDGSFALAIRRSYIDALVPHFVDPSKLAFTTLPRYYDYQARLDYAPAPHWKLTGFVLGSDDQLAIDSKTENLDDPLATGHFDSTTTFTRGIAAATYDRPGRYNKLAVSGFVQQVGLDVGTDRYIRTKAVSFAARDEARIALARGLTLLAGGESETKSYDVHVKFPRPPQEGDPAHTSITYDPLLDTTRNGMTTSAAAWTALEFAPVAWWKTTAGVRVDAFTHDHATVIEPRLQQRIVLSPLTSLLAGIGLYTRPADNQDENLQTNLEPERAWQSSLGAETKVAPGVMLTATAYYVDRSDLIVQNVAATAMSPDGTNSYTNDGIGRSYGAELLLKANIGRFFGWAAYTFSRSDRRDEPTDAWRKFDTDQTHNLVLLASTKLGARDQWQVGGRFQYTSGSPYTPVVGAIFDSDRNQYNPTYGAVNSQRAPAQHQLDLRVDHYIRFQHWKLATYLDVANVYMNAPVYGYQYNENYTKRTPMSGLPILPSLGARGEF